VRSFKVAILNKQAVRLTYTLPTDLHFEKPHVARLATISGTSGNVVVSCSFVKPQNFNDEKKQVLGFNGVAAVNPWVALQSNFIPSVGEIEVELIAKTTTFKPEDIYKLFVVIEVAPQHGTHGQVGV
jgi:hypothetical protein